MYIDFLYYYADTLCSFPCIPVVRAVTTPDPIVLIVTDDSVLSSPFLLTCARAVQRSGVKSLTRAIKIPFHAWAGLIEGGTEQPDGGCVYHTLLRVSSESN